MVGGQWSGGGDRGVGGSALQAGGLATPGPTQSSLILGSADRAAEGDRSQVDRARGRCRAALRQAPCRQRQGPGCGAVHGREPVAAPGDPERRVRGGRGGRGGRRRPPGGRSCPTSARARPILVVLEHLRTAGVQQAHRRTASASRASRPGRASTSAPRGGSRRASRKRAAILIGPSSARSRGWTWSWRRARRRMRFDLLIACGSPTTPMPRSSRGSGRCRCCARA